MAIFGGVPGLLSSCATSGSVTEASQGRRELAPFVADNIAVFPYGGGVAQRPPSVGGDFFAVSETASLWASFAGLAFLLGQPLVGVGLLAVPLILPHDYDPLQWISAKDKFLGQRLNLLSNVWRQGQGATSINFLNHDKSQQALMTVKSPGEARSGVSEDTFAHVVGQDMLGMARLLREDSNVYSLDALAPVAVADNRDQILDTAYTDISNQIRHITQRRYITKTGAEWLRYIRNDGRPVVFETITRREFLLQ